ncbi:ras-related protein Rab-44 isoform X2 [Agelaius phoeniceus]|uniref:ras-related protein Rab-44 isoform X2 n=1 Tax=Agelaius phoeniceus TaxID=39638 RepID=UPI004054FC49
MQAQQEAESLDTTEEQGTGANVQLMAEGDELRVTPGGSTETNLQPLGEAGCSGTEQGGNVDPEVQPLHQGDKAEVLERKAEDAQADMVFHEGPSPEGPQGGEAEKAVQLEEEEDGAQGQGEHGLSHEPELDLQGSVAEHGEGADEDVQAQEEAESLGTTEEQSSGANVQLMAEGDELRVTQGGSTETNLQLMSGSSGTEQGRNVDPDVQHLDQGDKAEVLERKAEDVQADMRVHEGPSPGAPWGGESERAAQLEEEEDGAQGQGEDDLSHEPELDLQGSGAEHGEGADEEVQAQEEAESLGTTEEQSSGANVQLMAEEDELKSASGESTEADLQPLIQTDSMGTEQVAPDVQSLDQGDKAEVVEREAEESWTDTQLCVTASPETPRGGELCAAVQPRDGAGDGAQGQGVRGQMQELVPDPSAVTISQRRGTDGGVQPVEEAESLDTVEEQSSGAIVQLMAEGDELRVSPGGSTETNLQPLGEAGSSGTEQGGKVDPEVQSLHQEGKEELVEGEAEDVQADMVFHEDPSPEGPQGGEGEKAAQLEEEGGAQGQGEDELLHEPELDMDRSGVRQREGADEDVQAQEEAESLDTTEDKSSGANVQLMAEGDELRVTPGGSTEANLQVWGEAGCSGTEQGGKLDPEVQPLHQEGKAEVLERKAEDVQADMVFHEGPSPGSPRRGQGEKAAQLEEEEDGAQGQGEHGLSHEPELDLQGSGAEHGEGADEDMQAEEEAESLDTTEEQGSGAIVQLMAEGDELRLTRGGSTETDLQPLGEAGCSGTEQGGKLDPDVQSLHQDDKEQLVEGEAEDAQTDMVFHEDSSPEGPQGGEGEKAVQLEEEGGAQGQGEDELLHEPELDMDRSGVRQGGEADEDMQAEEEAESLDTTEDKSSGANVQLMAEGDELKSASGKSTEADLQPLIQTDSMETEQVAPDVQSLDQGDKAEVVEREAEESWTDTQLCVTASPETPRGGEFCAAVQPRDGAGDGAQGQGVRGQMQELVPDPSAVTISQRRGTDGGVQPVEEAESLDTVEEQSSGAIVQLMAEGNELRVSPGGSTETNLQPLGEAGSSGTEQGGKVDPEVQPLHQEGKEELVEGEAEDAQADMVFHEDPSPEGPQGGEAEKAAQLEEEDGAQVQGEHGLSHEPELDMDRSGVRQREGAGEDMQAQEEAESLDTTEEQSSGANVQLMAEGDELRVTPGGSTEANLQLMSGSSGTEQGGSVDPEVQPLHQEDKEEVLERKAEDAQADMVFHEVPSPGAPWGGEGERAAQLEEEEDGAQGQGEHGLSHEPELDLQGSGVRQGGEADEEVQAQEEAESLGTTEEQGSGAIVQLMAEGDELRVTPGGSTEANLQVWNEAGSSGTEQGGIVDPEVQHLDQEDKAELVEGMEGEAEDVQADLQLSEGLSPGAPWVEGRGALQNEEEEEGGAEVPGENGLPQESVLAPEEAGDQQGEGPGAQPQEEAGRLHTLEAQSTDAGVQLFTDQQMPKSGSGGSTEADLTPLGVAGLWEGEQSLTLGLEAVLGTSPTAKPWEGAAAADVPPPAEAATAAEGPGLEAKLGACIAPEGQILEAQELLQGERAPAEGKPLDGAHGLEVAQGERLEAGVRNGVKTQGLGLNQGHDDAELASLVSEALSQLSPLKLETMMQEDVLIPDVWRLCAPGQAAQREPQEQVSAQGHEGRLHKVTQQPEGETPPTREPEHTAAGPAEHPKQEVPPASPLHKAVQPGDAGNDQLGVVLRENSLGQRQLLGEQSKDISVGQREKMQEFGEKMSQEGEPSSGEPGAVTAAGAGAAPQGCPKAALDPDHLYNVLFVGDSHVGKTSFLYRLHADTFNPHLTATVGLDYQIKNLVVDNKRFALRLWDSAGQERYRSMTKQFFRKADGVVLMYDITSEYSFSDVRYWLSCIQVGAVKSSWD